MFNSICLKKSDPACAENFVERSAGDSGEHPEIIDEPCTASMVMMSNIVASNVLRIASAKGGLLHRFRGMPDHFFSSKQS